MTTRELLDGYKFYTKHMISQVELVLIINEALNNVNETTAWKKSFTCVNMCPSKRLPFSQWMRKIEVSVKVADRFFTNRTGLFNAMPACW